MRAKPLARCDTVLVDHTERAKTHEAGVVVLAERERVPAVEPVEARVAARRMAAG
jgi:hypothetical protein